MRLQNIGCLTVASTAPFGSELLIYHQTLGPTSYKVSAGLAVSVDLLSELSVRFLRKPKKIFWDGASVLSPSYPICTQAASTL